MSDLYQTLGISKTANAADIKKAYHKIARTCHPDVAKNDQKAADRFKQACAAYEILSNPQKRQQYDAGAIDEQGKPRGFTGGSSGMGGMGGNPFGGGGRTYTYRSTGGRGGGAEGFGDFDINDIFSMFGGGGMGGMGGNPFSGARSRTRYEPEGQDVSYELTISFVLAAAGGETAVRLGSGKQIKMKIPAGINDGATLRLKGQGVAGGDALIKIHITPDKIFTRNGNDILINVPVALRDAVLGAKVTIPTLTGQVSVAIPPYTSSGKTLRLKGKGIAGKGDLLAKVLIILPARSDSALTRFMKDWK